MENTHFEIVEIHFHYWDEPEWASKKVLKFSETSIQDSLKSLYANYFVRGKDLIIDNILTK